jgi:hypothetical protein
MGVLALVDENRYADYTTPPARAREGIRKSYVHFQQVKLFIFTSRRRLYAHTPSLLSGCSLLPLRRKTHMKNEKHSRRTPNETTHTVMLTQYFPVAIVNIELYKKITMLC